jgi:adenylate kinase family enzyme
MHRVLVIGSPGAGKSTLSHAIAARTGLPICHLDRMHWLPGWIERDRDEARGELAEVLKRERWIIDGNYGSILPMRLARADTVVWLDYPTRLCLWRALKRWWQYRGNTRPDMTEGCPERLNAEFLIYVLTFRANWRARNSHALDGFSGDVVHLTSPDITDRWLTKLGS